jgi:hypothetical protein
MALAAADKLRELRALFVRTNVRLLPLRNRLEREGSGARSAGDSSATVWTGKALQAFLVDTADAHQSEYVSAANMRRAFLTGFTGSNGTALVTEDKALMWTDGRYFLQAEKELSGDWTLMKAEEPGVPTLEVRCSGLACVAGDLSAALTRGVRAAMGVQEPEG